MSAENHMLHSLSVSSGTTIFLQLPVCIH